MVKQVTEEQAKVPTEEGQSAPVVEESTVEVVKPEAAKDKGKEVSEETWEQKFKTLEGMYKQEKAKNTGFETLLTEVRNISSEVKQHGEALELHTELLSSSSELSEEAQEKVKKSREVQETKAKAQREAVAKGTDTLNIIKSIYEPVGITETDEVLKPAQDAFRQGNFPEAIKLTVIAAKGKMSPEAKADVKPAETETKEKKSLKVMTKPSAHSKSSDDLSSREKVLAGLEEAKRKQG